MVTYLAGPHIGIRHAARRVEVLRERPDVALTIDTESFPPETLLLRGRVTITDVDGIASEYRSAARRYMGDEAAEEMLTTVDQPGTRQATIRLRPTWAGLIDFGARRPSAQGGIG